MRIVTFSDNEFSNMWLFFKDAFLHPLTPSVYVHEKDLDIVLPTNERDEPVNNVEYLQDSLFTKELEYINLQLDKDPHKEDYYSPEGKKLHFGVPFYISSYERLLIIKNYLEERIKGLTE